MKKSKINESFQEVKPNRSEEMEEADLSKRLRIPFSVLFQKEYKPDIYSGEETISFNEKDKDFKRILKNEFNQNRK